MAHPEPSSRLFVNRKRARQGAPFEDLRRLGGVVIERKGVSNKMALATTAFCCDWFSTNRMDSTKTYNRSQTVAR